MMLPSGFIENPRAEMTDCDLRFVKTPPGVGKSWGSSRKGKLGLLEPTIGNRCPDL